MQNIKKKLKLFLFMIIKIIKMDSNVLQKTFKNLSSIDLRYQLLREKIDLDTIIDLENRN